MVSPGFTPAYDESAIDRTAKASAAITSSVTFIFIFDLAREFCVAVRSTLSVAGAEMPEPERQTPLRPCHFSLRPNPLRIAPGSIHCSAARIEDIAAFVGAVLKFEQTQGAYGFRLLLSLPCVNAQMHRYC